MACDVSWLRLEQFALGELVPRERADVEHHVATCPHCQRSLSTIEQDARPMPAFIPPRRPSRWWGWPAAVAVAALLLLWLVPRPAPRDPSGSPGAKGGDVVLSLVRSRGGTTSLTPTTYADGDRFQALVTCPPGPATVHLEVIDSEAAHHLGSTRVQCGNQIPIGDAFELTGDRPVDVCATVTFGPDWNERICHTLDPST